MLEHHTQLVWWALCQINCRAHERADRGPV